MWNRGAWGSAYVFGRGHRHVEHRNNISGKNNTIKQTQIIKHCSICWEEKVWLKDLRQGGVKQQQPMSQGMRKTAEVINEARDAEGLN